ncbi:MAG: hypothetical protein DRQ01_06285 [Ignavibacteriae bacterium]|nr:MAG: hypothetical protein DRQ01_06285 [Ignavibacteriota bacterium]
MHRTTLIFAGLFIFISLTTFAQITKEEYNHEIDELNRKKDQLNNEITNINFEIESLQNRIPELEQEIIIAFRELYVLKYGEEIGQRVAYKQIWTRMTDEMVRDGWGEPDKIDKNVKPWGVFTQWHYGDVTFFFRDGKLTEWDEE